MSILKLFTHYKKYCDLTDLFNNQTEAIYLSDASSNFQKLLIVASFSKKPQNIVVVYPNIFYASKAYEDFLGIVGSETNLSFFPVEEFVVGELAASSSSFRLERMKTYVKIFQKIPQIIITSTEGLQRHTMSYQKIQDSFLDLQQGSTYLIQDLINDLVIRGYKKTVITETSGTFSVRGSIVDIFIIGQDNPYRIEFFDNEIEQIKSFDVETQRTIAPVNQISVFPLYELFYQTSDIALLKQKILAKQSGSTDNEKIKKDFTDLENYNNLERLYIYLPDIDPNFIPFIDLLNQKTVVFSEYNQIVDKFNINTAEITEYLLRSQINLENNLFKSISDIINGTPFKKVYFTQFSGHHLDQDYLSVMTSNNIDYNNNLKNLVDDLALNQDKTYLITYDHQSSYKIFKEVIDQDSNLTNKVVDIDDIDNIQERAINFIELSDGLGFEDYQLKFRVLSPIDYLGSKMTKHHKYQRIYNQSIKIYNQEELVIGDYVVHRDYGIGRYLGIHPITLDNFTKDYLKVEYAGESKLFIPVEKIYVIEKYVGNTDKVPKLSKCNTNEWKNRRDKIKARIKELAKDLIKVQNEREKLKGYQYLPDNEYQKAFEEDFGFVETRGQMEAISAVKADLESTRPMDRLICGDVGFGKTEVALRAAFKVVQNNKQVAYLAPTTVLCRQQYLTFKERFEKYGARVEQLSRFVDDKTAKLVLEGLASGYIDVVVGTHRILSTDLKFKNLGLLVIDEEHRFGVEQKEKIKKIKADVDILALSATPIPRTLSMSLSGLREFSLIDTPPVNRIGVQTYVVEKEDAIIREAINRELGRNGQVFFLSNRINKLEKIHMMVKRLVPEAKVGVIHGRMDEDEVEDTLKLFLEQEYNVLVCTTIIESGVNIPNANTIIIDRADTLGLAQIYQIRGRVGRSDQVAYAYLMYDQEESLTEAGAKRLETIKQFTELGSGYKIAMRDLSIRGAGDILGREQSGFISDLGVELYMQMLNEAVDEENGIVKENPDEERFIINMPRHISSDYIGDDSLRLAMHNEISKVTTRQKIDQLIVEFTDRFGQVREDLAVYLEGKYLEYLLKSKGVERFKETSKMVEFNFDQEKTRLISYPKFLKLAQMLDRNYSFYYVDQRIGVKILLDASNSRANRNNYMFTLTKFLETLEI